MDKDKLIEFAKEQCEIFPEDSYMGEYLRKTLKMLQAEPCEDTVSREDVIKAIDHHTFDTDDGLCLDEDVSIILEDLPPVKPKQRWIPVSERIPEDFPCLASDSWGQMWIPVSVVTINNRCFDGKDFEFDIEKFFKGKEITMRNGVKVRELPREIIAWMPLPKPYKAESEET